MSEQVRLLMARALMKGIEAQNHECYPLLVEAEQDLANAPAMYTFQEFVVLDSLFHAMETDTYLDAIMAQVGTQGLDPNIRTNS